MQWWEALRLVQKIFFCIAAPASLLLVVQSVLVIIGIGGDSVGIDADGMDTVDGSGTGAGMFTSRGIIAFLTIGGWAGVWAGSSNMHDAWVVVIAMLSGAAAFVGMGFLIGAIYKLQSDGTLSLENCVGKTARVYVPIPPAGAGSGKISITVQERLAEVDAVTDAPEKIPTEALVRVVELVDKNTVRVEPLCAPPAPDKKA